MRRARPNYGPERTDPEVTFGGIGALAFYKRYIKAHPEAATAGPTVPDLQHSCDQECPIWTIGNTSICRASGQVHECNGLTPCSKSVRMRERNVCTITGNCSSLDFDFEQSLLTSHHDKKKKGAMLEIFADERGSHSSLTVEQGKAKKDKHELHCTYLNTLRLILKGIDIPAVWDICLALWRLRPTTGGTRHESMQVHVLTVLHMVCSDFHLFGDHVVWNAFAEVKENLPERKNWKLYNILVVPKRVTHREVALREAITDMHLIPGACRDVPCSVVR